MEEQLIEFVKQNKMLYDKTNSSYKNIFLRDKKFEELASKLEIPATKLKNRWRTLRDKFYKEIKKVPPSGSGGTPRKKWKWMEQLMFLKDVDHTNASTSGNFQRGETNNFSEESSTLESLAVDEIEQVGAIGLEDVLTEEEFILPETMTSTPVQKSKKKTNFDDLVKNAHKEVSEVVTLAKEVFSRPTNIQKSPIELFFESLGKQADQAQLTTFHLAELQSEVLKTFNKVMFGIE